MIGPYLVQESVLQTPQNAIAIIQQSKLIRAPYLAAGSCFLLVGFSVLLCYFVHVSLLFLFFFLLFLIFIIIHHYL